MNNSSISPLFAGIFLLVALGGAAVTLVAILIDVAKSNWRRKFLQYIRAAAINGSLKPTDLDHIAERWNQDRRSVLRSLLVLHSDAVAGEDSDLAKLPEVTRGLLQEHQTREPFAELPENISLQLNRIANGDGPTKESITQLATSLSELYSANRVELLKQKRIAIYGFFFALLGMPLTVQGLYNLFFR
jgi:hypothetical protein